VVSISDIDTAGRDLEQLLAVPGDGVGQVDDVEDLGAAEAGDLHSSHAGEATAAPEDVSGEARRRTSLRHDV
jgi:hypothetical protein